MWATLRLLRTVFIRKKPRLLRFQTTLSCADVVPLTRMYSPIEHGGTGGHEVALSQTFSFTACHDVKPSQQRCVASSRTS
jgi:hypothetical protein